MRSLCLLLSGLLLTACSLYSQDDSSASGVLFQPVKQESDPVAPLVIRVVGYGALNSIGKQTEAQKRLMALRASKMDAYRAMAERVYGTTILGSTTIQDMVVHDDRLKTYVETSIHGARVVSTSIMGDGSVETLMEMTIDQGFRNCLQTQDSLRFNVDCRVPLGRRTPRSMQVSHQGQAEVSSASSNENGFYFIE